MTGRRARAGRRETQGRILGAALLLVLAGCRAAPEAEQPPASPYVLILGTAQDGGLPQIGSDHRLDQAAREDPRRRRLVASLLVADPRSGRRWLIDATPDLREQVDRARGHPSSRNLPGPRPPLFEGIFLTHAHMGHYSGLLHLGREAYDAQGLAAFVSRRMAGFLANNGPWSRLVAAGNLELVVVEPGTEVELAESLTITVLLVPHRDEFTDTLGFVIRGPSSSLLYIPDIDKWERWEQPIEAQIAAVDHALLDGTFFEGGEIPGRDMSDIPHPFIVESLGRFAALPESERQKIHFTHLNHTNPVSDPSGAAATRVREAGMSVARDGQIFRL